MELKERMQDNSTPNQSDIKELRKIVSGLYFIAFTRISDKDIRAQMVADWKRVMSALDELAAYRKAQEAAKHEP